MSSVDSDPVLRNYSYLGYSYNILKLDPTDLMETQSQKEVKDDQSASTNPRNIVDLNAQGFEPVGGQPYQKPKNTIYQSTPSLKDEVFAKYQRNVSEYYEQHNSGLSLGLGILSGIFGFTSSLGYSRFVYESTDQQRLAVYSHQYVQNHRLALSESENAVVNQIKNYFKLGQEFQNRVKALPNSRDSQEDKQEYKNFIENVGTHYTWEVRFGGRKNNYSYIGKDSYERLEGEGINVNLGAEFSFKKLTGQLDSGFEDENMKRFQEETAEYYRRIETQGGSVGISDLDEWVKTIPDDPVPVKIKLALVYELLIPELFEDEPEINRKRQLMQEAYQDYLKENGIPSETRSVLTVVYEFGNSFYQFDYTALEWPPEQNQGLEWNKATLISPSKGFYPAVSWYENKETLYSVFKPMYPQEGLGYSELYQFGWSSKLQTNGDTSMRYESPGLAEFDDKLYCAFIKNRPEEGLFYMSFDRNNNGWTRPQRIGDYQPNSAPALAAYNGKLYCYFVQVSSGELDVPVSLLAMDSSENWERVLNYNYPEQEAYQVGAVKFEDKLICVLTGKFTNLGGNYGISIKEYGEDLTSLSQYIRLDDSAYKIGVAALGDKCFFIYNLPGGRLHFITGEYISDPPNRALVFSDPKRIENNNANYFNVAVRKSNLPLVRPKMN
ncbi:MAG: hypothetical protein F6K58_00270 [Symploca sp. SIO2E9]|nr:hypothetical protein [Symploca sp. SIO2E9]